MADILSEPADLDSVRFCLGVDAITLPDRVIDSLTFLGFVESEVQATVTDWSTILAGEDADTINLKLAVASWTAARVCGYLERNEAKAFKIGPYSQSGKSIDWTQKKGNLMMEAKAHLGKLSTFSTPSRPMLFTRDGPTRSRTNIPSSDDFEAWEDLVEPQVVDWLEDLQA